MKADVQRTQGGNEEFDQAQAEALALLKRSHSFALFAITDDGQMKAVMTFMASISPEGITRFASNVADSMELIMNDPGLSRGD